MPETRTSKSSTKDMDHGGDQFVSMATLNEMLKIQERMFKTMFDSLLTSVNMRIDSVVKSVGELKASLEFSQGDIDDLQESVAKITDMEEELDDIQQCLDKHDEKIEYLENQSRRNNIRIDGIPEETNESWSVTEEIVKKVLTEKLHLEFEPTIERAHRIGGKLRPSGSGNPSESLRSRPRTIVCRLNNWKEKEAILKSARQRKPTGLFINEDLATETLEKRKEQMERFKDAKRAGKLAYFVLDKLVIRDRPRQGQAAGSDS